MALFPEPSVMTISVNLPNDQASELFSCLRERITPLLEAYGGGHVHQKLIGVSWVKPRTMESQSAGETTSGRKDS